MPCMNCTSAPVKPTCERSAAAAAATTRLGSPGAPGWTIGGFRAVAAVRHAAPRMTERPMAIIAETGKFIGVYLRREPRFSVLRIAAVARHVDRRRRV